MLQALSEWIGAKYEIIGVVVLGAVVKIFFSQDLSPMRAIGTGAVAVFAAVAFTPLTVHMLETRFLVPAELVEIPVAAVWTLIGEGLMRSIIGLSTDSSIIGGFIRRFLGAGQNGGGDGR